MTDMSQEIKILFFSSKTDKHFKKISSAIPKIFPSDRIVHYSRIKDFAAAVREMLFGFGVVLITIRDEDELDQILSIKRVLNDHSVILVLDSSIDDMTHKAFKLYPRYTSYFKEEYADISLVLERMIPRIQMNIAI